MGPFFSRVASFLKTHGAQVFKVHFNGGDAAFWRGRPAWSFRGTLDAWPDWLEGRLAQEEIDAIVVFGQSRHVHRVALELAEQLGIASFVFEEGYVRPDYVTLERGGVNGRSSLPRDVESYRAAEQARIAATTPTRQRFARMAWYATAYAWATWAMRWSYPSVPYHRELHPVVEALRWIRGGIRKLAYAAAQRRHLVHLTGHATTRTWFLFPLQVHNDHQLSEHSPYNSIEGALGEVMTSFAQHAPPAARLVVKHHPMDRAYRDYSVRIAADARKLGIGGRVIYVHDLHLPTLLRHARGVVTVNSTTGLQALRHGTPVCTLGDCIYAIPGLTHRGTLEDFWHAPQPVDRELASRFRRTVIRRTQLNASFYGDAPALRPVSMLAEPVPDAPPSEYGTVA